MGIWIFCCVAEVMGIKKNSKDMFQTPEFKQPDVKHDQRSCGFELTHPKKIVLTLQSVLMAVHMSLEQVHLYSSRLGTKKNQEQGIRTEIQRK